MLNMSSTTHNSTPPYASGYRMKLDQQEFLDLLRLSETKRVYKVSKYMFFAFDGFIMFTQKCSISDVEIYAKVVKGREFSNAAWQRR